MEGNELLVERVSRASEELVEAMARLVPQLSSSAPAPDLAALEQVATSPGSSLLVARVVLGEFGFDLDVFLLLVGAGLGETRRRRRDD